MCILKNSYVYMQAYIHTDTQITLKYSDRYEVSEIFVCLTLSLFACESIMIEEVRASESARKTDRVSKRKTHSRHGDIQMHLSGYKFSLKGRFRDN